MSHLADMITGRFRRAGVIALVLGLAAIGWRQMPMRAPGRSRNTA